MNPKYAVMDEDGLDAMLLAILTKLKEIYVNKKTFEDEVSRVVGDVTKDFGFVGFEVGEDGHLIVSYTGITEPKMTMNADGHLILELE